MLVGLWVWLIGVLVLVVTFWLFAPRRPALGQIEIGVVYLWMSFCIMPVLDVVHLVGVPTLPLTERLHWQHFLLGHFSLLLMSPVRMTSSTVSCARSVRCPVAGPGSSRSC